ncbi:MAG TPA: DUF971 domain-containing protein [Rhodoblastus sp.]|nr:DUF971 domain-containing protein [Rhodoblastus sp.]
MSEGKWPTELRLTEKGKVLKVAFESGEAYSLPAELLRVESPSAEVQGHSPAERKTVSGKRDVAILAIEPVGNYAAKLEFDDTHSTGLYTWDYLFDLGARQDLIWQNYLNELKQKGLSR